jgi:hypothetical protein
MNPNISHGGGLLFCRFFGGIWKFGAGAPASSNASGDYGSCDGGLLRFACNDVCGERVSGGSIKGSDYIFGLLE